MTILVSPTGLIQGQVKDWTLVQGSLKTSKLPTNCRLVQEGVQCSLPDLSAGANWAFEAKFVPQAAAAGTTMTATIKVATNAPEQNVANNIATTKTTILPR